MKNDIITVYEDEKKVLYKLLLVIEKDYKYIVYTKIDNNIIDNDLFVAKVNKLDDINETLSISEEEWDMIEKEYNKLLEIKNSCELY